MVSPEFRGVKYGGPRIPVPEFPECRLLDHSKGLVGELDADMRDLERDLERELGRELGDLDL